MYQASTFDIVIGIVIDITVLVVEILLLRIVQRRLVRAESAVKSRKILTGIEIGGTLMILLSAPLIIIGGITMALGGFATLMFGLVGTFIFVLGAISTGMGILIMFIGTGLKKMTPTAWKGAVVITSGIILYSLPIVIFGANFFRQISILNLFLIYSWSGGPGQLLQNRWLWGIILIISGGFLIYLLSDNVRRLSLTNGLMSWERKEEPDTREKMDEDQKVRKCPMCGRENPLETILCPFCGYSLVGTNNVR
jgi:hypothetical protein